MNTIREWDASDFSGYIVTGVDVEGRRFRRHCPTWSFAQCINVYRGSRWGIRHDGRRVKLETVYN